MIYSGKAELGQISRSLSLNSGAIRLKRPKNLTQIGFPSLRSVKSNRPLEPVFTGQARLAEDRVLLEKKQELK